MATCMATHALLALIGLNRGRGSDIIVCCGHVTEVGTGPPCAHRRVTTCVNGAQSALWAEINRQPTKIRVRRILRAVRFERFNQWTTSNNITDWLIFLLMLAWTVTFADAGARNRQACVQNYGHGCTYNFRTFPCKYWLVTSMKIEPVVIIIIRTEHSIQKMFKINLLKAINMILEVFIIFSWMTCLDFYRYSGLLPSYKLK